MSDNFCIDLLEKLTDESRIFTGNQKPLEVKSVLEGLGYTFTDEELTGNDATYLYTKTSCPSITHNVNIFGYGKDTITLNTYFNEG